MERTDGKMTDTQTDSQTNGLESDGGIASHYLLSFFKSFV